MTKVSIAITTYQDRPYLERLLKSLRNSEGSEDFEIIVVDDDPNEPPVSNVIFINPKTADVSDELAPYAGLDTNGYVKWVKPSKTKDHYGPYMAREIGLRKATGDYIVTCDSDIVVPKHWWVTFKHIFDTDPKIQGVGPRIFPAWNQWIQYLPHEDTLKEFGAVKDLIPEDLDTFDMSKYIPEWFDLDYIPDVHNVCKSKYGYGKGSEEDRRYDFPFEEVLMWDSLTEIFACFPKDMLYKLRKDGGEQHDGLGLGDNHALSRNVYAKYNMRLVVSNRVAVWCGREDPLVTTIPWRVDEKK